jgi:prolipoprotein diacylglyceryltransferase
VDDEAAFEAAFGRRLKRGAHWLEFEVSPPVGRTVGPFAPHTLGLHPTQVYESISTALLLFLLYSLYPYKTRDGVLMVIFMLGYGLHRFLNEMLRIDNEIVAFGMTFSQNISIVVLIAGAILGIVVWRRPPAAPSGSTELAPAEASAASTATEEAPCPPATTTSS